MGAWGHDTFDNDTAGDWKYDLEESQGLPFVEETLAACLVPGGELLDADRGCCGLAACELIARLGGRWGTRDAYTESLDEWVTANPSAVPSQLTSKALQVIDRILGPDSELAELWDEDEAEGKLWRERVQDLRARVRG